MSKWFEVQVMVPQRVLIEVQDEVSEEDAVCLAIDACPAEVSEASCIGEWPHGKMLERRKRLVEYVFPLDPCKEAA